MKKPDIQLLDDLIAQCEKSMLSPFKEKADAKAKAAAPKVEEVEEKEKPVLEGLSDEEKEYLEMMREDSE